MNKKVLNLLKYQTIPCGTDPIKFTPHFPGPSLSSLSNNKYPSYPQLTPKLFFTFQYVKLFSTPYPTISIA